MLAAPASSPPPAAAKRSDAATSNASCGPRSSCAPKAHENAPDERAGSARSKRAMSSYILPLLGLAAVHLMAAASPGPSFVLVAQTAVGSGRRAGLLAAFAMMLGAVAWAAAALYGLQALFARFAWLYLVMRIGGGLYLLYLAVMLWRHAKEPLPEPSAAVVETGAMQ